MKGTSTVFSITRLAFSLSTSLIVSLSTSLPCVAKADTTLQDLLKEYKRKADAKSAAKALFENAVKKTEYDKMNEAAELFTQLSKMDPKCAAAYFGLSSNGVHIRNESFVRIQPRLPISDQSASCLSA